MPYTEKQEREKLLTAMTVYRVFLYTAVVCFLVTAPVLKFWNLIAELFMLAGFAWHLISLRRLYLKEPENFQIRPKLIALLLTIGLAIQSLWLIGNLSDYLQLINGTKTTVKARSFMLVDLYPDSFVKDGMYHHMLLALILRVIAFGLLIAMFVLFSQFKAIHTALEVTNQTATLADSDPLGIADELRKLKTPGTNH